MLPFRVVVITKNEVYEALKTDPATFKGPQQMEVKVQAKLLLERDPEYNGSDKIQVSFSCNRLKVNGWSRIVDSFIPSSVLLLFHLKECSPLLYA